MSYDVNSDYFTATYFDDDVEHGCEAKWYVTCKHRDLDMAELADYAEYVTEAYCGDGGHCDWELDPAEMMRRKLTIQEALASYERALELHDTYNGCYPDDAIYDRANERYRSPTDYERYGV